MYLNLTLRFFTGPKKQIGQLLYIHMRKAGGVTVTDSSFCSRWSEKKVRSWRHAMPLLPTTVIASEKRKNFLWFRIFY